MRRHIGKNLRLPFTYFNIEGVVKIAGPMLIAALLLISYGIMMTQSTSRMYWPYMLCSYMIATLVFLAYEWRQSRRRDLASLRHYLFSKDIWLHRSAVQDYALFLINYYIFLAFSYHFIFTSQNENNLQRLFLGGITALMQALHLSRHTTPPGLVAVLIFTFCSFMLAELFFYIWHRTTHRVPWLWAFHKVHHSAEVMTPLTFIRNHPLDLWIEYFVRIVSLCISSSVFYYLYPSNTGALTIAGVDLATFLTYVFAANLHHSHIWLTYGQKLEHFFISPAQHQIHHSNDPKHYDRNFGSMIAFWDWLFGTLYVIREREKISFGLTGRDRTGYNTIWDLYISPLKSFWKFIR